MESDKFKALKEKIAAKEKMKDPRPKKSTYEIKKEKKDNEKKTSYKLTYDEYHDEYILDIKTKVPWKDVPHDAVHVTGKKGHYLWTDLWDELIWPGKGQSAIHMYLWVVNEKINTDTLLEKKSPISNIDWKKILIYGAVGIAILLIAPKFIH